MDSFINCVVVQLFVLCDLCSKTVQSDELTSFIILITLLYVDNSCSVCFILKQDCV